MKKKLITLTVTIALIMSGFAGCAKSPTNSQTDSPTPTIAPTVTVAPTEEVLATAVPTEKVVPTAIPTATNTPVSTATPTAVPTVAPTNEPTVAPTIAPVVTEMPLPGVTVIPTEVPVATEPPVPTVTSTPEPTKVAFPTVVMPTVSPNAFVYEHKDTAKIMTYEDINPRATDASNLYETCTAQWKAGDNATLTLYTDGTLVLSGSGDTYDYGTITPWQDTGLEIGLFDTYVKKIVIEEGISYIGQRMFCGIDSVTAAYLPSTVRAIGEGAFLGCKNLTEIVLNEGLTTIGKHCFCRCPNLTKLTLPSTLIKIDNAALQCNLTQLVIPASVTYIGDFALCEEVPLFTLYIQGKSSFDEFDFIGTDIYMTKDENFDTYDTKVIFEK